MTKVAVFGTGSWGTTFAQVVADAGPTVNLVSRRTEIVYDINNNHRNDDYLPGVVLSGNITATLDPEEALHEATVVVLAIPSQTLRANLTTWVPLMNNDHVVVSLAKGLENGTRMRMSEVIEDCGVPRRNIAVVSGPNLAKEIAVRQPTATVVAAYDERASDRVARACSAPYFRPYQNTDVVGVEVGGVVKNVVAIATGAAAGLGMGMNTQSSLITRGIAETIRLADAVGGKSATLAGLAGMGDMTATCFSELSRNRTVGFRLGQGEPIETIMATPHLTAEGVKSAKTVSDLGESFGVDMPIAHHMHLVVEGKLSVFDAARSLLDRPLKHEGQ